MIIVFWFATTILFYVYVGYPVLLVLMKWMRPAAQYHLTEEIQPTITMVISAFNEQEVITEKINNALALDYPGHKLSIIVVSDCSDDETDAMVQAFESQRVQLLRMEQRSGKSIGLNHAVQAADSDLILFTDANAMFARESLNHMVSHFADNNVGVVTGQQRYELNVTGTAPTEEGLYWRIESAIKKLESDNGNLVGGDGAIMMIRRNLFFELAEDDLSDYLLPMQISMRGYRNHYEQNAICTEKSADSYAKEYQRKVRIVNRAWRATMKSAAVLNIFSYGKLSLFVWSHKVFRWLTCVWMLLAAGSSLALYNAGWLYQLALLSQGTFYLFAYLGFVLRERRNISLFSIPYYFCSVNFAALQGIVEHYQGKTYATWNTPRTNDR